MSEPPASFDPLSRSEGCRDRAAGVLLVTAVGDALGVPYEFARPPGVGESARMLGGGLGDFAPGEWSDDTSMAAEIAQVAASGVDLTSDEALDAVAEGFLRWYDAGPPDIGMQTSAVLGATRRRLNAVESGVARIMQEEARVYALDHPHSAGNGALMRTAAVPLTCLEDRSGLASAARLIAGLTHADPVAGDSCVLWCEAIRVAVIEGRIEVSGGLDLIPGSRRDQWRGWIEEAMDTQHNMVDDVPGRRFRPNGYTVTALQAALAAIVGTAGDGTDHLQESLHNAVRIGDDTDTVAAIAGGLLGGLYGASAVPEEWRRAVHGWPGLNGEDLVRLGALASLNRRPPTPE